jgi:hypothetical protein
MTLLAREDMAAVSVVIDGVDLGVAAARTGGAGTTDDSKTRLGGMGGEVSLGGAQTRENITVRFHWDLDTVAQRYKWLESVRGRGRGVVVTQPLDPDGNPYGDRFTYTGTVVQVTPPDYDAQSNDAAFLEVEISADSPVA